MYTNEDELSGLFTFKAEGSTNPKDPFFIGRLSWPGGESGVTIGAGYDMRHRSKGRITDDLTAAGTDPKLAEQLAGGAGLAGVAATNFVNTNKSLAINDSLILQKLFNAIYPAYVVTAKNNFSYHKNSFRDKLPTYGKKYAGATFFDWRYLYPSIRVIAIDFTYQGFGRQGKGYERPLHFCMMNNFDWLIEYITNTPGMSRYEAGRGRAAYLRKNKDFEIRAYSQCAVEV